MLMALIVRLAILRSELWAALLPMEFLVGELLRWVLGGGRGEASDSKCVSNTVLRWSVLSSNNCP